MLFMPLIITLLILGVLFALVQPLRGRHALPGGAHHHDSARRALLIARIWVPRAPSRHRRP